MTTNRRSSARPAAAAAPRDPVGRVLFYFLLLEPTVDLFYFVRWQLGPFSMGPIHVAGVLLGTYLAATIARLPPVRVPYARLFLAFIIFNVISFALGQTAGPLGLTGFLEFMIKVSISFLCYVSAYRAGIVWRYGSTLPFVKAGFGGVAVAILANLIAIQLGLGGIKAGDQTATGHLRETGLYYDSGVLALVALQGIVFGLALLFSRGLRGVVWHGFVAIVILAALFLIYQSLSRSAIILLGVTVLLFLLFNLKALTRQAISIGFVAMLAVLMVVNMVDFSRIEERFATETQTIENIKEEEDQIVDQIVVATTDDENELSKFDSIGNNRGRMWRLQIEAIMERPVIYLLFGSYRGGAHSDYIDVLARNGLVGLVIYVSLLTLLFRRALATTVAAREYPDGAVLAMAFIMLSNYILYSIPFRPLSYSTTSWFMWMFLGLAFSRGVVQTTLATRRKLRRAGHAAASS